eukprot:TRINITY_DN15047_c0_g2_i1.p1 TRINITY_DN15047_c0_g2~~TRINITY_DN15047_c0_g2_i1.p1  ORF type:complete len:455 (-),score=34.29 TRINITY_DN15047_c0_g2_i1:217-1581(-)
MEFLSAIQAQPMLVVKLCATLGSFVLAVLGCLLARHLEKRKGHGRVQEMFLVFGNTFASGVLLAASLTHMLPDANESLKGLVPFSLANAIAGGAFCFLVILGEVLTDALPKRDVPHTHTACATYEASFALWPRWELSPPHGCAEASMPVPVLSRLPEPAIQEASSSHDSHMCGSCEHPVPFSFLAQHRKNTDEIDGAPVDPERPAASNDSNISPTGVASLLTPLLSRVCPSRMAGVPARAVHSCHSHSTCCRVHRHADSSCNHEPDSHATDDRCMHATSEGNNGCDTGRRASADLAGCHVRVSGTRGREIKSFLLFFALGFHSVMEGLGLGSAQQEGLLLPVMIAILTHKALAAFALGCSLSHVSDAKFLVFVLLFAIGTPVGVGLGLVTSTVGPAHEQGVASGICIALAGGTFLQVASMELLPRVLAEGKHKWLGSCGLVLGFTLMASLAIWV